VTGASSGIGRAFAYELAARGANLIFASRSKETLNGIARDVRSKFKVETEVVAVDLAGADSPERLFSKVKALNRTVLVLINNAGFGTYGKLHENSLEANGRQILLNAFSPAILAQLFLPAMVAAGDGAIVNIASTAGFQPHTLHGGLRCHEGVPAFILRGALGRKPAYRRARPCALSRPGGHGFLQGVRLRRTRLDRP
jgi:short-subunit dehydrogenase